MDLNIDLKNININDLKEKVVKIATVLVRASPIMETLTGIMIAGLIYYSGKLIIKEQNLETVDFLRARACDL